jgi:hypothetical protein
MSELRIITNNVPRDIVYAWQLTADERAEFDYLDWAAIDDARDSASFVRYKGEILDLNDLEPGPGFHMPNAFDGWHAYRSDTFFSGILVRWVQTDPYDDWQVVMGRYYA